MLAVLAVTGVTQRADAQRTGSHIGGDAGPRDDTEVLAIMANRIGGRNARYVRDWLSTVPGSREEAAVLKGDSVEDFVTCTGNGRLVVDGKPIRFKVNVLRSLLAGMLVRQKIGTSSDMLPVDATSRPWFADKLSAEQQRKDADAPALSLFDFGHCVAMARWSGVRALFLAADASPAERAGIRTLVPALGRCLSQDVEATLTPAILRRVLSEPVYNILQGDVLPAAA